MIEKWKKTLIPETATIADVICNLNESMVQIALVINPKGNLVGTLTDGDIRRGLLNGLELSSSIDKIVNYEPLVVTLEMNRETALQLMQINKIHQLPVVNENRCVVGLHLWNELIVPGVRRNVMVIMAGGKGTRLRPHTENCPKPLLPVGGKPMLEHIIERAKAEGFHNFILSIHYLGHMIEDYFADGSKWQVNIDYVREEQPLGTAGALSLLKPRPNEAFLVSNGDVLTDVHYGELLDFHSSHNALATMAVRQHEWQHPFGVVQTKGVDIIGFDEKPITHSHINAGIYVLEPEVLDSLKQDEYCDMPTLFSRQQDMNKRTIVYPMHEPWLDVGRVDDLHRARKKHSIEN